MGSMIWVWIVLLLGVGQGVAQDGDKERPDWLDKNALMVRTIAPEDTDFDDLMDLKKYIGKARVVGLGEPSHGDGATFHAKTRLVKFLHQEMGFDLMVWESGMADCMETDLALKQGEEMEKAFSKGIFSIWTQSAQMQPLFRYVAGTYKTDKPLQMAGMDCQMNSMGMGKKVLDRTLDFLKRFDPTVLDEKEIADLKGGVDLLLGKQSYSKDLVAAYDRGVKKLQSALESEEGLEVALLAQLIRNLSCMVKIMGFHSEDPKKAQLNAALAREPAMAETLLFYAQKAYPDRKIIVWAANDHLSYNTTSIEKKVSRGKWVKDTHPWRPLGNDVREALGDDYYAIEFIAYEGEYGMAGSKPAVLKPPVKGSFESLCFGTGKEFLFVDFRSLPQLPGGEWLKEKIISRARRYYPMRASWPHVCDAFFYTKTMFPSTKK